MVQNKVFSNNICMRKALKNCIHVASVAMILDASGGGRSARRPWRLAAARHSLSVQHCWSGLHLTPQKAYNVVLFRAKIESYMQEFNELDLTTLTVLMCCAILFRNLFHDGRLNNFRSNPPSSFDTSAVTLLVLGGLFSVLLLLLLLVLGFIVPNGLRGNVKVRFKRDPSSCLGVMVVSWTSLISSPSEHDFKTEDKLPEDIVMN